MSTKSYLIAQQVISRIKAQCPRIVSPTRHAGRSLKNSFTFFAGSDHEQTIHLRRVIARANPFWDPLDYEPMLRDWKTRINARWLSHTYIEILSSEIYTDMGIPEGTDRYHLENDLPEIVGRALQIAKAQIWGIPVNLRQESWFFHRLITGCAKKTVPEDVWKLACVNVGNFYGINESVLIDAILEQKAYQSLYAIHPLLGRSYVPWIRSFVTRDIHEEADHSRYAQQFSSALGACGVRKSGVKTLHRMAESSPSTFRDVMRRIVGHAEGVSEETVAMLNLLNGRKPSSSVTFKHVFEKTWNDNRVPARHPEDIMVMTRIDQWLAKDMRFDRELVLDWMRFLTRERRGSLYRGYLDVTKPFKSPAKRREAAIAWANRSQQTWHRHRPQPDQQGFYAPALRSLQWEPIVKAPETALLQSDFADSEWQFMELTSSEALRVEGDAMQHCVAGYDEDCYRGRSHIFSVRDTQGTRVSTLELRPKQKTRKGATQYAIVQNRGIQNAVVSPACKKAAEQFLKRVNAFLKKVTGPLKK